MSIRPVDKIPKASSKTLSYRDLIRNDINDAMNQGISKFEFTGDCYNYKYLAQTVREEVGKMFREEFNRRITPVRARLTTEFDQSFPCSYYHYVNKYIRIHAVTQIDKIHVYAEIDYDFITRMEEIVEADLRAYRKVS